jgi:transketolase
MIPSASAIRRRILEMSFFGQSVHVPSAFSIVEIVRVLHDKYLRYPENDPNSKSRDFFVLSKGHGVMALYPILESRGWISSDDVKNYFQDGSSLPGLSEAITPGCEVNSGSLGHGLSVAAGLAWAAKLTESDQRVFCLIGDGELNEGSIWEALMFAGFHGLGNFAVIIDQNGFQAMGETSDILAVADLSGALESFGFKVRTVDGHSEQEIEESLHTESQVSSGKPLAVIARTTKGKGVSFIENENRWHYTRLDQSTFLSAIKELESRA